MTRRVCVVGIGCGHPDQLTVEAVEALRAASYAIVPRKRGVHGQGDDPLVVARRAIVERYAPGLEIVEVDDPERDRSVGGTATTPGYERAVADWHEARAAVFEGALAEGWARSGGGDAVFLVWGDPAFYDSTIRIVERVLARGLVTFDWDVVPGISALQLLAARHRIVLHEVGQPILVTTGRKLHEAVQAGHDNLLVMLNARLDLAGLDDWWIWWGANLGTPDEHLIAGRVGDVLGDLGAARESARTAAGWVMDVFVLRRPTERRLRSERDSRR